MERNEHDKKKKKYDMKTMTVCELFHTKVTVFESVTKQYTSGLTDYLMKLVDMGNHDPYKSQIEYVRQFSGKETKEITESYVNGKKKLPVFTPSCVCGKRGGSDIESITNVLCIDIDEKENPGLDVEQCKEDLMKLPSVFFVSRSIGGRGVYGFVAVDTDIDNFKDTFEFVKTHIYHQTGYVIDENCSNPNRLRFISHDDDFLYKEPKTKVHLLRGEKRVIEPQVQTVSELNLPLRRRLNKTSTQQELELIDDNDFCISCVDYCVNRLGIQTSDYNNWLSHLSCLCTLGPDGEQLGLQLSRQSPGYQSDDDVLKKMKSVSGKKPNSRDYMTRYFHLCKESLGKSWIQDIRRIYDVNK